MYDRTACTIAWSSFFPEEPIICNQCRLIGVKQTRVLPNRKHVTASSSFPGPGLATDATTQTPSVIGGPSFQRGNALGFQKTFEAQELGAHIARRPQTAAPARGAPP